MSFGLSLVQSTQGSFIFFSTKCCGSHDIKASIAVLGCNWHHKLFCCLFLLFKYRQNYVNHMKFFPCVHNKPAFKPRSALCQTSHTREWLEKPLFAFSLFLCLYVLRFMWPVLIYVHLRYRDDNIYIVLSLTLAHAHTIFTQLVEPFCKQNVPRDKLSISDLNIPYC